MFADLHVHSLYSDGRYAPEELCKRAFERGISLLSVTDHDTLAGEEQKREAAKKYGLRYVTGWEISAYAGAQKTHILGYGCQLGAPYFSFMNERKNSALLRAEDSVNKLRKLGIPLTLEEVLAERSATDLPVHTMHVARALGKKLNVDEGRAYLDYLGVGAPAHSSIGRPSPKQAIDCIHACGGIASIAHPGRLTLGFSEREEALLSLVKEGADCIEAVYTTHTKEETEYFVRFAKENGLLVTGGSDTHFEEESHEIGSPRFVPSEGLLKRLGF